MEGKDRWEQKGRIFLPLFISFTLLSAASRLPFCLHSLPTTYHPTMVHRHHGRSRVSFERAILDRPVRSQRKTPVEWYGLNQTTTKEQLLPSLSVRYGRWEASQPRTRTFLNGKDVRLRLCAHMELYTRWTCMCSSWTSRARWSTSGS